MEKMSGGENVRNLYEIRKQKEQKQNRTLSEEHLFDLPEREVKITLEEAISTAREILKTVTEQDILNDFIDRESYVSELSRKDYETDMRIALSKQREEMMKMPVDSLVKLFDYYTDHATHYYKTTVVAAAEALTKRFPNVKN